MPAGKTHDRITLWLLPWLAIAMYVFSRNGELTLLLAGGFLFSGLMFGPDLDIHSLQFKRWGVLRWLWLPYQKLMRHRSLLSHGLLIGTILRLLYLLAAIAWFAFVIVAIAQLIWGFDWNWQKVVLQQINLIKGEGKEEAIALFIGLELGAMSHSCSDWIGSAIKRRQKKKQKLRSRK